MPPLLSLAGMLLCTAVILFLAYWVTRKIGLSSGVGNAGVGSRMRVLDRLPIGTGQSLLVVQLGEQCFVLGVSKEHISLIAELTEEQAQLWKKSAAVHTADTAPAAFFETLSRRLHGRDDQDKGG